MGFQLHAADHRECPDARAGRVALQQLHRAPLAPCPVSRSAPDHAVPPSDIEEVLADWDELLDVDVDDLDAVFRAVERKAAKRELAERPD